MKRFWRKVGVVGSRAGFGIELDGRPVRTPLKKLLMVPAKALADAIAEEWNDVADIIDPRAMPLTGLANAAIDRVAPERAAFPAASAKYAEADLACYRADGPRALVERQAGEWDALLGWARRRFDVDFAVTTGITHV